MKVLFAVNNESISESIIKKYQQEYREIISVKNVYYFNAIIKELQRDKTYDRIVISEDLQPFSNNNYDAIDKFIFEKMDSISDEATNQSGNDIPIILICTDRRETSEPLLVKLFGIGVYNALIGKDRSITNVCELLARPRTKKEAKVYYRIDSEDVDYKVENEGDVSEVEIHNILNHYKKLGGNEQRYVESFEHIASQYTDAQLRLIANCLPLNVKAVLEANCMKYQEVVSFAGGNASAGTQKLGKTKAKPSNNYARPAQPVKMQEPRMEDMNNLDMMNQNSNRGRMTEPVVIPSAINTQNVRRMPDNSMNMQNNSSMNTQNDNSMNMPNNNSMNMQNNLMNEQNVQGQNNIPGARQDSTPDEMLSSQAMSGRRPGMPNQGPMQGNMAQDVAFQEQTMPRPLQPQRQVASTAEQMQMLEQSQTKPNKKGANPNAPQPLSATNSQTNGKPQPLQQMEQVQQQTSGQPQPLQARTQTSEQPQPLQARTQASGQPQPLQAKTKQQIQPDINQMVQPEPQSIQSIDEIFQDIPEQPTIEMTAEIPEVVATPEPVQPKRRGRPKKVVDPTLVQEEKPKRGRGRPKKVVAEQVTVEEPKVETQQAPVNLFELGEEETVVPEKPANDMILPGLDEEPLFTPEDTDNGVTGMQVAAEEQDQMPSGQDFYGEQNSNPENSMYQESITQDNYNMPDNNYSVSNDNYNVPDNNYNAPQNSYSPQTEQGLYNTGNAFNNDFSSGSTFENNNSFAPFNNGSIGSNSLDNINGGMSSVDLSHLLTSDKKIVAFVGTSKNGTSFLVNNIAEMLSQKGINTAILDLTKNKNAYYIYTENEESIRKTAYSCIDNLRRGNANGIQVHKNLTVYTTLPEENEDINDYGHILETLLQNYSLILLDCDFDTNYGYFKEVQELYLVQSLDVLTIQPLTAFLRNLKAKNALEPAKIRIVLNKVLRLRSITEKTIIGGMAYYNDPAMSFMTELFNKDTVPYCSVPFDEQAYSKYLEGLINCKITLNGYSKNFMAILNNVGNMVYPLISNNSYNANNNFSSNMNSTLNKMKTY